VSNAPRGLRGPNINRVIPWFDFGFEGMFQSFSVAEGDSEFVTAANMPNLDEHQELSDTSYTIFGGAWTGGAAPYSLTLLENITQAQVQPLFELPRLLGVAQPVTPLPGGLLINRYVEFDPNSLEIPDFYLVTITNALGLVIWQVILPGNEPYFQLPEFPDFSDLPEDERPNPYVAGTLNMEVVSARAYEFDYDEFEYNDFSLDNWEVFTFNAWTIRLR
ncbi:MAG: hypothetical protein AAFX99_36280, partial [Myxococcota bacterium]